jgi:hypothetical protein
MDRDENLSCSDVSQDLRPAAITAMRRAGNDPEDQVQAVVAILRPLVDKRPDEIVHLAAQTLVYRLRYEALRTVKRTPCNGEAVKPNAPRRVSDDDTGFLRGSVLDYWTMPDGRRLGDQTGKDLDGWIKNEQSLASGHSCNARFYKLLRAEVDDDETVRAAVKPTLADTLKASVWKQRKPKAGPEKA